VRKRVFFVCSFFVLLGAENVHAQTVEQLRSEGQFNRKLIQAREAKDCRLALRLLRERKAVVHAQVMALGRGNADRTPKSIGELMHLDTQMRGLEHRHTIISRECRASR